jgi:protein O-GlcNAc transferase
MLNTGRFAQAEELARRMVQAKPKEFEGYFLLAAAMYFGGKTDQGLAMAKQAYAMHPAHGQLHNLLAQIAIKQRRMDDALMHAKRSVELDPREGLSHNTLGAVHLMREEAELAMQPLRNAVRLNPFDASAINNLARVYADHCMVEEACVMLDRALQPDPNNFVLLQSYTPFLNYPHGAAVATRMAAAKAMAKFYASAAAGARLCKVTDFAPARTVRVGIVSCDFRTHSCAYFLRPLLKHLARDGANAFHVHGFCCNALQDEVTAELRGMCDGWHDVHALRPAEVAKAIADSKIDILLELGGYTSGSRLEVCCYSPAAMHVAYMGYPGTTAVPEVAWRLVDTTTDLADQSELFTERLHRMDGCFLCYDPGHDVPALGQRTRQGPVTFGSFSATTKICTATTDLWAKVLRAVPESTLFVKGWAMAGQLAPDVLRKRFAAAGVDPARLRFAGRTKGSAEHLRMYDEVDIALDTTPYVGTTTTCEALMMGVPVVTLAGVEHRSRVGASLLKAAGMSEFIARDDDAYVKIAAALAGDRATLAEHHATLRQRLLGSALCDGPAYAARLGDALRTLWRWRCEQA